MTRMKGASEVGVLLTSVFVFIEIYAANRSGLWWLRKVSCEMCWHRATGGKIEATVSPEDKS